MLSLAPGTSALGEDERPRDHRLVEDHPPVPGAHDERRRKGLVAWRQLGRRQVDPMQPHLGNDGLRRGDAHERVVCGVAGGHLLRGGKIGGALGVASDRTDRSRSARRGRSDRSGNRSAAPRRGRRGPWDSNRARRTDTGCRAAPAAPGCRSCSARDRHRPGCRPRAARPEPPRRAPRRPRRVAGLGVPHHVDPRPPVAEFHRRAILASTGRGSGRVVWPRVGTPQSSECQGYQGALSPDPHDSSSSVSGERMHPRCP